MFASMPAWWHKRLVEGLLVGIKNARSSSDAMRANVRLLTACEFALLVNTVNSVVDDKLYKDATNSADPVDFLETMRRYEAADDTSFKFEMDGHWEGYPLINHIYDLLRKVTPGSAESFAVGIEVKNHEHEAETCTVGNTSGGKVCVTLKHPAKITRFQTLVANQVLRHEKSFKCKQKSCQKFGTLATADAVIFLYQPKDTWQGRLKYIAYGDYEDKRDGTKKMEIPATIKLNKEIFYRRAVVVDCEEHAVTERNGLFCDNDSVKPCTAYGHDAKTIPPAALLYSKLEPTPGDFFAGEFIKQEAELSKLKKGFNMEPYVEWFVCSKSPFLE